MKLSAIVSTAGVASVFVLLLIGCAVVSRPGQSPSERLDYSYSDSAMTALAVEMVGELSAAELPDKGGRPKLAFVGVDNTTDLTVDDEVIAESIVSALVRFGRFRVLDRETVRSQIGDSLAGSAAATSEEVTARLGRIVTATFFLEAYVTGVTPVVGGASRPAVALALYLVDVDEARQVWSAERVLSRPGPTGDSLR